MVFPFGDKPPKKDGRRVVMDIVSTSSKEEMKKLVDYLVYYEGCVNIFLIEPDDKHHSFHVDLYHKRPKAFSYVGLHVRAEQVYHGAKSFTSVDEFIDYRKNLSLN